MKKVFFILFLITSINLFSADLVNRDSKSYSIEIKQTGSTHTSISSNTTQINGAPDGATIIIKETGSAIKVNGSSDVIIQNGQLKQ